MATEARPVNRDGTFSLVSNVAIFASTACPLEIHSRRPGPPASIHRPRPLACCPPSVPAVSCYQREPARRSPVGSNVATFDVAARAD